MRVHTCVRIVVRISLEQIELQQAAFDQLLEEDEDE